VDRDVECVGGLCEVPWWWVGGCVGGWIEDVKCVGAWIDAGVSTSTSDSPVDLEHRKEVFEHLLPSLCVRPLVPLWHSEDARPLVWQRYLVILPAAKRLQQC
jgi:hypothetical protein